MIKLFFILCTLCILPITMTMILKVLDCKITFTAGYIIGEIVNLTIFSLCIRAMAEDMAEPGLLPIKVILGISMFEILAFLTVLCIRCIKEKKWIGFVRLFYLDQHSNLRSHKKEIFFLILASIIWILGATSYLRYVSDGAVSMMAYINRLDFFGATNVNPMIMLGYYLTKLGRISQADAICLVIPLSFYFAFVILMWETAGALFESDMLKKTLCFFAESVLVVVGDCLYTQPFIVLHGLNQIENVLLVLCVPFSFAIGLRLYQEVECRGKNGFRMYGYWFALALCVISTYFFEQRALTLIGLNTVIFVLLFAGRRYLPWLQSSRS